MSDDSATSVSCGPAWGPVTTHTWCLLIYDCLRPQRRCRTRALMPCPPSAGIAVDRDSTTGVVRSRAPAPTTARAGADDEAVQSQKRARTLATVHAHRGLLPLLLSRQPQQGRGPWPQRWTRMARLGFASPPSLQRLEPRRLSSAILLRCRAVTV